MGVAVSVEARAKYHQFVKENKHIPAYKIIKSVAFGLEMAYYDCFLI